ncbi:MAG TPA: hypothetical protein DIU15_09640, partial [Deltaproteobacteria bacterium]|nr:hypothetical protein [Deltaproteobacteria bacterium]
REKDRRAFEHVPVRGLYPMREWKPGDYIEDIHEIKIRRWWKGSKLDLCLELLDENKNRSQSRVLT